LSDTKIKYKDEYYLVNKRTNEVDRETSKTDTITVITEEQMENRANRAYMLGVRNTFVKKYGNFIFKHNKIRNELTESDEVRLAFLATYVDYHGVLVKDSGLPLQPKELFNLIGVKREIFNKWYSKLITSEIIIEQGGYLILDKDYYSKGTVKIRKNSHTRVFITAMRNLYNSNKGSNLTNVGHIFKILPYISLRTNDICWNPNSEEKPILMTAKEMLDIFGISTKNILRTLQALARYKISDEQLFRFSTDHINYANDTMRVCPLLFFNGDIEDFEPILEGFRKFGEITSQTENVDNPQ